MLKNLLRRIAEKTTMTTAWDCAKIFNGASSVLLVLNQPLNASQCALLTRLWPHSKLRVTVDGGSNRLLESLPHLTPDLVTGDLDSINEIALRAYKDRGSVVLQTVDENFTDFTKCLRVISTRRGSFASVLAFCAHSGRFDQTMANISTLYKSADIIPLPVFLHSGNEVTWLLQAGKHRILTNADAFNMDCGLLPIGLPVTASTEGLKWDLNSTKLAFSGRVSSSNKIASNEIFVETDGPVVWTMSLKQEGGRP